MSFATVSAVEPASTRLPATGMLPPLSLYIHIPWCVRKCPYCDFNSHEARGEIPEERYVAALVADLEQALPQVWGRRVQTVFFGGGTPSLFSARAIETILAAARARLALAPDAEVTLEANPGTVEADKFADFRGAGVNRLSIGVQSFDPRYLKALGRIHDDAQARRAVEIAQAHFDNVNLDLMYALPAQTVSDALADIDRAIAFSPQHVSAYHLTIEPNTYFARFPPPVPGDETTARMQDEIEARLADAGYRHYETSAFARPGREARHNRNYWEFGDYLGIGAGAHSKLSFPATSGRGLARIARQMRWKHPRDYLERCAASVPVQIDDDVPETERAVEFMMNALRLADGFAPSLFEERTGLGWDAVRAPVERAQALGLVEADVERVRPTLRGQRFLNDLLQLFMR